MTSLFSRRIFFVLSIYTCGFFSFLGMAPAFAASQDVDVELAIRALPKEVEIFSGSKTKVWSYEGTLIKGPKDSLTSSNTYLGPTLRLHQGQRVRVHFTNELTETSIIHWHGLDVPSAMDGHPRNAVDATKDYTYEFTVENRAALYWYHPHPHMRTGYQVYQGLAGLFVVTDDEEAALNLPSGDSESILVLQDRSFDDKKQLQYVTSDMDQMMGMYGDTILVNGSINTEKAVPRGPHRVRVLNGSNARTYNLTWEDHRPIQIIGTDGGLLSAPVQKDSVMIAPGERLDFWVDFSSAEAGKSLNLISNPLVAGRGKPFTLYTFRFTEQKTSAHALPATLSRVDKIALSEAINSANPKRFAVTMDRNKGWTINGRGYELDSVAPEETVKLGTTEVWEFTNNSGMAHPLHIHGSQFQILERHSGKLTGAFDDGWKDTVLLLPGDKVRLIKRFYKPGWFVYHCHILEHEDMSMMRNYFVAE
jgi:FtsP/CotA-like multicopper oxidase with cupredoxin domain